ncbi:TRAP transporter substrate-binding protein [Sneathiella chinensis]|uniref:C4-dicarboxylate ABC transporter n=1 Tax=Sneathiella chinensis TaxID=349750 RepID=A0ABQ5U261_9PROT|nr:TRAP transporter substrate-binding protein [Sneathiella chinensis]GLQ05918.1 C4-dicarboxylate ABC transporter [Sneathiella chinensis]
MSKTLKTIASIALAGGLVAGAVSAQAADVKLRLAHFMPQNSWQNDKMFMAWKKAVEEQSEGRIKVTVFPAQTLGKAPAGYDNAKNGIADIAWTVQGYTAGRFPLSQIMELPNLFDTGAVGSCAFQKLYESGALDEEYKETKVLYVHTHSPGHLHTKDTAVTTLDDLKGLKIRRPTEVIGGLLTELGAEPVGMPAPEIYANVQRGVIDGYMLPWSAVNSFRAYEVSKQHTDFGFYSLAFVTTMNKAKYDSLPDDLKKVIDDNSGMEWSVIAGGGYDAADEVGLAKIKEEGGQINIIAPEERKRWEAVADEVTKGYLAELDGKNLPGTETYNKVKGYIAECRTELN